MDPVKEPACAVCGATTDLVGREGHGWVCAVSGPCIERSSAKRWLPARPWTIPGDIPEENQKKVVARGAGGFQAESTDPEVVAAVERLFRASDMGPVVDLDCSACGSHENVWRGVYGFTCEACYYGDGLPDYEALGYPETGYGHGDLDYAAHVVGFAARGIAASVIQSELQKDIRVATDIVDSGDWDSYK